MNFMEWNEPTCHSRHISSINSFVSLNECKLTEIDRSLSSFIACIQLTSIPHRRSGMKCKLNCGMNCALLSSIGDWIHAALLSLHHIQSINSLRVIELMNGWVKRRPVIRHSIIRSFRSFHWTEVKRIDFMTSFPGISGSIRSLNTHSMSSTFSYFN